VLDELKQFATARQLEYIEAINKYGSHRQAAKALNVGSRTIDRSMLALQKRAAVQGFSPQHDMTRTVPEPFVVRGVSTYYNKDGKPSGQWVKSRIDDDKYQQMILAAVDAMKDEIPRESQVPSPAHGNAKLCNCYVITDYHMGMLSWREETGADWDLKIAEQTIIDWFAQAIRQALMLNMRCWHNFQTSCTSTALMLLPQPRNTCWT
jgi:hypothetical protein